MTSTKDIYWLAGLLEGEGCFGIMPHGQLRIQLSMADRDVIERAARLLGGRRVYQWRVKDNRQPLYSVSVAGRRAAGWMMLLYSLMGHRRQFRMREALRTWQATPTTGKWKRRENYKYGQSRAAETLSAGS